MGRGPVPAGSSLSGRQKHATTTSPSRSSSRGWCHVPCGAGTGGVVGCVGCMCDNQAAVHAVNKMSCRDPDMMCLIRCLFFYEAWWYFELVAAHLPGRENILADHLSHNPLSDFLSKAQSRDPAPAARAAGTLLECEGWTSPHWTRCFSITATTE